MTRRLAFISLFLQCTLWSAVGLCETVALLPLRYEEVGADTLVGDCAPCRGRVRQQIEAALKNDGHELLDVDMLEATGSEVAPGCQDVEELEKYADALGDAADRVICVWVRDETKDSATYAVRVTASPGGMQEETNVGGLETIASDAGKMVLQVVNRPTETEETPADGTVGSSPSSLSSEEPEDQLGAQGSKEQTAPAVEENLSEPETDPQTRKEKLSADKAEPLSANEDSLSRDDADPLSVRKDSKREIGVASFWISLALTGSLAAGYVTTEVVAGGIYEDLRREDDPPKWKKLRNDFDAVQTADRVLLGLLAAGAATTVVLGLLTDFSDDSVEPGGQLGFRIAPIITSEGSGVVFCTPF